MAQFDAAVVRLKSDGVRLGVEPVDGRIQVPMPRPLAQGSLPDGTRQQVKQDALARLVHAYDDIEPGQGDWPCS
jgi:hypothetical protein